MFVEDHSIPPYRIGDVFSPCGKCGGVNAMVVSVIDEQRGCAVLLSEMDYDFTDKYSLTDAFEKYNLAYLKFNKEGKKLTKEESDHIVKNVEEMMRWNAYSNGDGKFLLASISDIQNFFKNIHTYYELRELYYPSGEKLDIEGNYNCEYFLSRTMTQDMTGVYVYDVKKKSVLAIPLGECYMYSFNVLRVLEYYDFGHHEVRTHYEDKSSACYVATAVYGSYDCPEVWTLRRYRDNVLDCTWYGRLFIRTYYAISPTLVKWFGATDWFRNLFYGLLTKWVKKLNDRGFEDTPYKDKY